MHSQKSNNGAIAQLVEQRTENPCVPGSIPGGTTLEISRNVVTEQVTTFFVFLGSNNGKTFIGIIIKYLFVNYLHCKDTDFFVTLHQKFKEKQV